MNGSDLPLPADCARCPLRIPLPDNLSDAAVAGLVETLYLLAPPSKRLQPLAALLGLPTRIRPTHEQSPPAPVIHHDLADDDLPF